MLSLAERLQPAHVPPRAAASAHQPGLWACGRATTACGAPRAPRRPLLPSGWLPRCSLSTRAWGDRRVPAGWWPGAMRPV